MTRARDVANLIGSGNYSSTTFTATAGQTAFTISHTQGFIQVFMNGLLLDETVDYTSNGSAVTLTSGAAAGDEIEVVAYNTFSVGDALNQAAADTRYVNATGDTVTGALTVDTSTTTNLTVDSANYGGIQFKAAGTKTGYITSFTGATESMYIGGADKVNIHTGTNHDLTGGTTRLQVDASGNVTMPYQPSFRAGASSSTSGSGTTIVFNTVRHNIGGHYNSSNGRFVAPVSGVYYFGYQGISASSSTSNEQNLTMYVNGVAILDTRFRGYTEQSGHIKTVTVLSPNDYVEIKVTNANTTTYGNAFHTQFMGFLIG